MKAPLDLDQWQAVRPAAEAGRFPRASEEVHRMQ